MQELWLWGFTRGSALLTCIYEFSVFHKVPGLKTGRGIHQKTERTQFTVTASSKGQSHEPHATAKPYLFILHVMIGNHYIFDNRYPFYIFKRNPHKASYGENLFS